MTENNNTFKQVYRSTDDRPFEVWFAPKDATIAWPFTETVPDTNLKAPKYDWKNYTWIETDSTSQANQLAELAQNQAKLLQMLAPKIAGKPTVPVPPTATVPPATTTPQAPTTTPQTPTTNGGNK